VVEVEKTRQKDFEKQLKGRPFGLVGCLTVKTDFKVYGLDEKICVDADVSKLKQAWRAPLKW